MADVAVSVHRDPRDVKNGSDDTETHEETADLKKKKAWTGESRNVPDVRLAVRNRRRWDSHHALCVSQCPSIMEEGIEDQWVGIEGYHQVSKGQTHHEHIT